MKGGLKCYFLSSINGVNKCLQLPSNWCESHHPHPTHSPPHTHPHHTHTHTHTPPVIYDYIITFWKLWVNLGIIVMATITKTHDIKHLSFSISWCWFYSEFRPISRLAWIVFPGNFMILTYRPKFTTGLISFSFWNSNIFLQMSCHGWKVLIYNCFTQQYRSETMSDMPINFLKISKLLFYISKL